MERLQKVIAGYGYASRRKAEKLIKEGKVMVNGEIVTELGTKVNVNDLISIDGIVINKDVKHEYYLLNKPRNVISSVEDKQGRITVVDLINTDARIYPIGRLDYDSSGLILLTNDGEVYNKIIHPRVKIGKKYIVLCKGEFTNDELKRFENGIDIGGYVTAKSKITVIDKEKGTSWKTYFDTKLGNN